MRLHIGKKCPSGIEKIKPLAVKPLVPQHQKALWIWSSAMAGNSADDKLG
jgi:hypothetical protein